MEAATIARACPVPDFTSEDAGKLAVAFGKLGARTRNAAGDVYRGDPNLIHAADGTRAELGRTLAHGLMLQLRHDAFMRGDRTLEEASRQPICPGCYMVIGFNMLRELARANGQSETELARTMAHAFGELARNPDTDAEHIDVILDPS